MDIEIHQVHIANRICKAWGLLQQPQITRKLSYRWQTARRICAHDTRDLRLCNEVWAEKQKEAPTRREKVWRFVQPFLLVGRADGQTGGNAASTSHSAHQCMLRREDKKTQGQW